ncbi:MAG TPA: GSU2403 family nucleotidyltransferase fold protein [Steroidobacteraceae bacterium]|nr:GSU2403 family nucleotidyltransferase fold protein [Steroidobacteraceae bacterium]
MRALYAEVKARAKSIAELLPGSPGTLVKRAGTGHEYWYRSYYPAPRKRSEHFVGTVSNAAAYEAMQGRIAQSEWTAKQVAALAKFGYQVGDKVVASVLVELRNRKMFDAGLVVMGASAYISWLNEFGAVASGAKTQNHLELARRQPLKLETPAAFLATMQATQLPFAGVPSTSTKKPPTSVKLPGAGLRVDLVAPGPIAGETVAAPELGWHAQAMPFYGYLLEGSQDAAVLAGGHCIPAQLPEAARMIWYQLYASTRRGRDAVLAETDLVQAATLAALMVEQGGALLRDSYRTAPRELRNAAHSRLPRLERLLAEHPLARDEFRKLK